MNTHAKFTSIEHLQEELSDLKRFDGAQYEYGFIVPGHGLKRKQKALVTNADIDTMYNDCKAKQINLWMKCSWKNKRKRTQSPSSNVSDPPPKSKQSNYDAHLRKMSDVELIVDELKGMHAEKYSPEQLQAWAHMIQMKRHESYDLPDKPFFGKSRRRVLESTEATSISPGKRLNMRSECIDQLEKWHALMERGAISAEQYKELQKTILTDIKKF